MPFLPTILPSNIPLRSKLFGIFSFGNRIQYTFYNELDGITTGNQYYVTFLQNFRRLLQWRKTETANVEHTCSSGDKFLKVRCITINKNASPRDGP